MVKDLERHARLAPRERTFAQLFPWRSIRRALMLVVLIVAIVVIQRRMGAVLEHAGQLWGPLAPPVSPAGGAPARTVHLGPTLAPKTSQASPSDER